MFIGETPRRISRPINKPQKIRGLGDLVAACLQRLGVKKRKGCGCGRRQAALNRWISFGVDRASRPS